MLMNVVMPYVVIVILNYYWMIPTVWGKEKEREELAIKLIRGICIYVIKTNLIWNKKIWFITYIALTYVKMKLWVFRFLCEWLQLRIVYLKG